MSNHEVLLGDDARRLADRTGGGGGVYFPDPPIAFVGANLAAARVARDAAFGGVNPAQDIAAFQGDQFLAIILRPAGAAVEIETYLPGNEGGAYDASQWIRRGTGGATDAYIDSRIAAPARANNPSGTFADARFPAEIARDAEIAAAVANLRAGVKAAYDTLRELGDKVVTGVDVRGGRIVLTHDDGSETSADATGLARTDAQINALIQAAIGAVGGGGITLAQALAAILAGDGVTIDRDMAGQITIARALNELDVFLADAAGAKVGDSIDPPFRSAGTDYIVALSTTAAARRWGFTLPAGRTLVRVSNQQGRNWTDRFPASDTDNPRRRIYNRNLAAAGEDVLVFVRLGSA